MKEKRVIRLINDERTLLVVKKALACESDTEYSNCIEDDAAQCQASAYDKTCYIDLSACYGSNTVDTCSGMYDTSACNGAGQYDE